MFRVTVEDLETGDRNELTIGPGDYVLIPTGSCYLHHAQVSKNGTVQLTLKGYSPGGGESDGR